MEAMKDSQRVWLAVDQMVNATGMSEAEVRAGVVELLAAGLLERGFDYRGCEAFRYVGGRRYERSGSLVSVARRRSR